MLDFSRVKTKLLVDHPYFGTLVSALEIVVNDNIESFTSHGKRFEYREDFFNTLSDEQVAFSLANASMHGVLSHPSRLANRSPWLWYTACDHAINNMLIDNEFVPPSKITYDPRFRGKYAEEIYEMLLDTITREDLNDKDNDSRRSDDTLEDKLEAAQQEILSQNALNKAQDMKSLPQGLERLIPIIARGAIDWRTQLRDTIGGYYVSDYTIIPPSKKLLYQGIYLPGAYSRHLELAIAIDNSGSVDEGLLGKDLKIIEDMHKEKGYFLARASYQLIPLSADSVLLEFQLDLGTKMYIGDVNIVGNKAFNDAYLLESMLSRPFDRYATLFGSPFFQQAFVDRDEQFLSFIYQDAGYAQMKVTKTLKELSQDQRFVNLTFTVDEGQKYHFGDISFEGDLLFSKKELHEYVGIAAGDLFRISRFRTAVENLERAYGDLGYAFVDVDPQTTFDTKNRRVGMKYVITSGKKAYFGRVRIIGNTKTRDNVIRRELSILDGELFGRTALDDSKSAVESLGFFEEVRFIRRLDTDDESIIHYTVKVKEKATGQVQASIGYTPGGNTDATWFGQGKYEEQNQSGRAWKQ